MLLLNNTITLAKLRSQEHKNWDSRSKRKTPGRLVQWESNIDFFCMALLSARVYKRVLKMGSYSPSPFTHANASTSIYKGLSPSEDFAFLMWCNSFDQGSLKLVTKQSLFPILVCFWWLWKTSPLSTLYDLIHSLSPRQNDQVLITAPLECDRHSVLKH